MSGRGHGRGGGRAGSPPEVKNRRYRRLVDTAKARAHQLDVRLDKARAMAARAISPDDEPAALAARDHARYVVKTYVHRATGSRIRILDTEAADRPNDGRMPMIDYSGDLLPYVVECLDHGGEPRYAATYKQATRLVRDCATWCAGCSPVPAMRPKVEKRAKERAKIQVAAESRPR